MSRHVSPWKARRRRAVARLLIVTLTAYPLLPYADTLSDLGRAGQADGRAMIEAFNAVPPQYDGGQIALPTLKDGTFRHDAGAGITIDELFPGTSTSGAEPLTAFFPDAGIPDVDTLESVSADGNDMDTLGKQFQAALYDDARSAAPSTTGSAYQVMMGMANRTPPDMRNDPFLSASRDVYANVDALSAEFGDCTSHTTFNEVSQSAHLPDYKTCERVVDKSLSCEVRHDYDAGVIRHFSGPYNIQPLDADSTNVWIGSIGDDYLNGSCTIHEQVTEFQVINPAAITRVTLNYAKWDDYIQILIGKAGSEQLVWAGPDGNFPPETSGPCELGTSWEQNPAIDLTGPFLSAVAANDVVRFKIRVSVTGAGEGYARLQIDYDPAKVVMEDSWTPQDCIDAVKAAEDGFADSTVSCTSLPPSNSGTGCVTINDVQVCEGSLQPSPFPTISPLCETVAVAVDYDFYKGSFCYTDASGEEVCAESGTGPTDTCVGYEADPRCGFISQSCVQGAEAADGTCYLFEEVWDCGEDVAIPAAESRTSFDCAGPVRCMGEECITVERTQSDTFAATSAQLNAAQFMAQDMNCVAADGTRDVTCEVFGGESLECKKAVGGVQDCCDVPTGTSPATYIAAMLEVVQLDSSLMALDDGTAIKGTYQTLRDPVVNTVSKVTKPFTSYTENISGSVTEFFEPMTTFVDNLKKKISDAIADTLNKMLGQTAADMGAEAAAGAGAEAGSEAMAQQAGQAVVQNAAAAFSVVMAAYTAYVVAVMAVQMIYRCEKEEFELAAKKDTKSCTYVGSYCADESLGVCLEKKEAYCCFNSPLSRIINTQLRPQLSRPFGDPESPDCDGIPMTQVGSIDWSQVDLTEWTALLSAYDLLPQAQSISADSLTGPGSALNAVDGPRSDAVERAQRRVEGLDIDTARREAAKNSVIDASGG